MKNFFNKINPSVKEVMFAVSVFGVAGFVAYVASKVVQKMKDFDLDMSEDDNIVDFNGYR